MLRQHLALSSLLALWAFVPIGLTALSADATALDSDTTVIPLQLVQSDLGRQAPSADASRPSTTPLKPTTQPTTPTTATPQKTKGPQPMYCPRPKQLIRKGMWWGLGEDWKSYSQSFVKQIVSFAGVQWLGIRVGHVICIYHGSRSLDFPIQVQYGSLVKEPSGSLWAKNLGGYKNCFASMVLDCPFYPVKKKPVSDIYQTIEKFKKPDKKPKAETWP